MVLEAIRYTSGSLTILDQLQLPHTTHYDEVRNATDAWHAIKAMRTRGAPAIAIVAALGLAVELIHTTIPDAGDEVATFIQEKLAYLLTSRPTAVNLADAAAKLQARVEEVRKAGGDGAAVRDAYVQAAEQMLVDDVSDNRAIGAHGAAWIMENTPQAKNGPVGVVTHCNTGSLATAGYGTALGVIRGLHERGDLRHAFCTETRPYNQGSRLTAYELVHDQIPGTLVTDSMAASLLRLRGGADRDNIAAIVVGADRVAANGDTANKIGTYALAHLAKAHGVKFLVAAPRTTIDRGTQSGDEIIIEQRPGREVTVVRGPKWDGAEIVEGTAETVMLAAEGIDVWNPAFDVTPKEIIDGIVTEVGVAVKGANGHFNLAELFER